MATEFGGVLDAKQQYTNAEVALAQALRGSREALGQFQAHMRTASVQLATMQAAAETYPDASWISHDVLDEQARRAGQTDAVLSAVAPIISWFVNGCTAEVPAELAALTSVFAPKE